MATLRNPILTGFHPDPSIVRVGDDYYIATSTFEWWPGVAIAHSRDLVHWRTLPPALTEANMRRFASEVLPAIRPLTDKEYKGFELPGRR